MSSPRPRPRPRPAPRTVVLLGTQRWDPSLGETVAAVGVPGKIAVITAGWQERESEDDDLTAHLGGRTKNLRLHARGEEVFRADPELAAAYRDRQLRLRLHQDCYRIRLEHALEADRVIRQRSAPPEMLEQETEASITSIRALDEWHLAHCQALHRAFVAEWDVGNRPAVARHRREIADMIADCDGLAIAGGHVATLVNRLSLFAIEELVDARPVFAWAGGAMAITERIVLFHDDPPQGPGICEVLDAGLGLASGIVVFPEPERRLRLDRKDAVGTMVRRFAPARSVALPKSAYVEWTGEVVRASSAVELLPDGESRALEPDAAPQPREVLP